MIAPHNKWYIENVLVCAHFFSKQAHGTYAPFRKISNSAYRGSFALIL